jgi:hypothetical protein
MRVEHVTPVGPKRVVFMLHLRRVLPVCVGLHDTDYSASCLLHV